MTETDAEIIVRLLAEVKRLKADRNAVLEEAAEEGEKWARSMNIDAMIAKTCGDRIRKLKAEA